MQKLETKLLVTKMGGVESNSISVSKGFGKLNPSFLVQYLIKAKLKVTFD